MTIPADLSSEGTGSPAPTATLMVTGLSLLLIGKDALVAFSKPLEWIPIILAVVFLFIMLANLVRLHRLAFNPVLGVYLGYVALSALMTAVWRTEPGAGPSIVVGTFTLGFFLVFWVAVYHASPGFSPRVFLRLNVPFAVVISILALYQFYIDPTLFGIVRTVYAEADSGVTKRAVSVFGTPQVLGIYLALMTGYLLTLPLNLRRASVLALIGAAMLMTGSKSVSVFFLVYFLVAAWKLGPAKTILAGAILGAAAFFAAAKFALVARVFGPVGMLLQRRGDARVYIWERYLDIKGIGDLLIGHGVGSAERVAHDRFGFGMDSAESYVLKVFFEVGMIGLVLFVCVYATAIRVALRRDRVVALLLSGFATNLLVVHTFAGLFISFFVCALLAWCLVGPRDGDVLRRASA